MPVNTQPGNTHPAHNLQQAADALWNARQTRRSIGPLRDFVSGNDLESAYAVQALNNRRHEAAGARRIGRKIGLTSKAVQTQLGVDQPDFGLLYDNMLYQGPLARLPFNSLLQPKIEGEIAFIVAADITESTLPRDELRRRAGLAAAAFEIVDSAITDWKITLADTVADNASCGALVVAQQHRSLLEFDSRLCGMVLSADGEVVSLGVGAASLGDPLTAFAWLAELAIKQGDPIRAGEVVLTGALGPMVPMLKGKHYKLEIAGFSPLEIIAE